MKKTITYLIFLISCLNSGCIFPKKINLIIDRKAQENCLNKIAVGCESDMELEGYGNDILAIKPCGDYQNFLENLPIKKFNNFFVTQTQSGRRIDLHKMRFHKLPQRIKLYSDLSQIHLRGTNEMFLDSVFIQLAKHKSLKFLSISCFKCDTLTIIPKEIGLLTNLVEIDIRDCVIDDFPMEIKKIKSLESISIRSKDSDIYIFKKVIKHLPLLKKVCLRDGYYEKKNGKWILLKQFKYEKQSAYCQYYIINNLPF